MPWAWRLLIALPVVLGAASVGLDLAYTECGYEGGSPCEVNWVSEWQGYTAALAFVSGAVVVFAFGLRRLAGRARPGLRPLVVAVAALAWAYAAGWSADAMLNDDGCAIYHYGDENGPTPESVSEWWPARTNCRVPLPDGGSKLVRGDAMVFYGVFGFWIAVAALAMIPGRPWLRLVLGLAAFAGSMYVIFA